MRWGTFARAVPALAGGTLLLAGAVQLTRWKARQLARCRTEPGCAVPASGQPPTDGCAPVLARNASISHAGPDPGGAWREGMRLGRHCVLCCNGLMATLLVLGAMDLRVMGAVGVAITAERLLPWPGRIARATGCVLLALGVAASAHALGMN